MEKNIAIYLFSSGLFQRIAKLKFLNVRIANRFIANTKVKEFALINFILI